MESKNVARVMPLAEKKEDKLVNSSKQNNEDISQSVSAVHTNKDSEAVFSQINLYKDDNRLDFDDKPALFLKAS